jgi:FkbH-like protein
VTRVRPDRLYFIADFTIETLARQIANTTLPGIETAVGPAGPVMSALAAGPPGDGWAAVVWTRPEAVSATFARALMSDRVDEERALDEVRRFAQALNQFSLRTRSLFVPTWVLPPFERGRGIAEWRDGGAARLLARMNLTLADDLRDSPAAFVLDAGRWIATSGARGWSQKLWYASKCPFTSSTIEQAAADIAAALDGIAGRARRLVILDLDDVLWGGVVGEVGWTDLVLGGHDHVGEAFVDFQRALKALAARGVQLAIVSKNEAATALEAIDRHPEMQLRRSDFAAWRIDWTDKAENVAGVLADLNLGPESAVFIDDSPSERARVAAAVPGILVPDWPADPARFREALNSLRCFDSPVSTAEDRARTSMYADERARRSALAEAGSLDDWLQSLDIVVTVEPLSDVNGERAAQLFNKTNQMNLATRRLSKAELAGWAAAPRHTLLTLRVRDRFGDYGLTGIVGVEYDGARARIVDFLLSCRVMGRRVEEAMLHVAAAHARAHHAATLSAEVVPTSRNAPCVEFFRRSGMAAVADGVFEWDLARPYDRPACVSIADHAGVVSTVDP